MYLLCELLDLVYLFIIVSSVTITVPGSEEVLNKYLLNISNNSSWGSPGGQRREEENGGPRSCGFCFIAKLLLGFVGKIDSFLPRGLFAV